jgi:hypothetical protein
MPSDELIPVVLLFLIGGTFGLLAGMTLLVLGLRPRATGPVEFDEKLDRPRREVVFMVSPLRTFWRRPGCWLAIRGRNLGLVQEALGLSEVRSCSWSEGLSGGRQWFIAPPCRGWILVFGAGLPDPTADEDECFRFLRALSRRVGLVQMFKADDALRHHAWAWVEAGRVVRAYAWAGRTLWNQGARTAAENSLGLKCFAYGEEAPPCPWGAGDVVAANVDKVPQLASRWSLNPAAIDARFMEASRGLAGRPGRPR